MMSNEKLYPTPYAMLLLFGILTALLFLLTGASLFVHGVAGVVLSNTSIFWLMVFATVARRGRPSHFWLAVFIGFLIALVPTVLFVREMSLQPDQYSNPWALRILPFATIGGSILGSTNWVATAVDRFLGIPSE